MQLTFSTYTDGAAIAPSDTIAQTYRGIYVGGTGTLTVIMESGASVLFSALPVGSFLPISVKQVMATGTTATLLTGVR